MNYVNSNEKKYNEFINIYKFIKEISKADDFIENIRNKFRIKLYNK